MDGIHLLTAMCFSILGIYRDSFNQSSVDGHLDWFPSFAITNSIIMHHLLCMFR